MADQVTGEWVEKLVNTKVALADLGNRWPQDQALCSALLQLDYLIALAKGIEMDDSRLEEIILGHLAVYPLMGILSHDLCQALCEINETIRRSLRKQGRQMRIDRR